MRSNFSKIFLLLIFSLQAETKLPPVSLQSPAKTVDISIDALYWYTSETVDWAFTLAHTPNSVETVYKTFVFEWAPGLCVGLGYTMQEGLWDTKANYTWFQSQARGKINGSVTSAFLGARLSLLEPFSTGKATLKLYYNMFEWDLGHHFFASSYLFLRPAIGFKGGWINQTIYSEWTIPNFFYSYTLTASENLKQRFQGLGPKGEVSAKWCIGTIQKHTFSLIGQFDTSYLWGHWSIHDHFVDSFGSTIYINTDERNFGSIVLHSFLGFGWDYHFNKNRSHIGIKLGYEIEDWPNQCQIFTDTSGSQNNDLILQGVNLGLDLDF